MKDFDEYQEIVDDAIDDPRDFAERNNLPFDEDDGPQDVLDAFHAERERRQNVKTQVAKAHSLENGERMEMTIMSDSFEVEKHDDELRLVGNDGETLEPLENLMPMGDDDEEAKEQLLSCW